MTNQIYIRVAVKDSANQYVWAPIATTTQPGIVKPDSKLFEIKDDGLLKLGKGCTNTGLGAIVGGIECTNTGDGAIVVGKKPDRPDGEACANTGAGAIVGGIGNINDTKRVYDGSLVVGYGNKVTNPNGQTAFVVGNIISGQENIVEVQPNASCNANIISGRANKSKALGSLIIGESNDVDTLDGAVIGSNNTVTNTNNTQQSNRSDTVFIAGKGNRVDVDGVKLLGRGLEVRTNPNVVVVGQYNEDKNDLIFVVGAGSDYKDDEGELHVTRKNALEVTKDGNVKVYSEPVNDDDVIRKKDLENKLSKIKGIQSIAIVDTLPESGMSVTTLYLLRQPDGTYLEYIWRVDPYANPNVGWEQVGSTKIAVDSELSDTSENPVQNKVIKKALDEIASSGGSSVDVQIDGTSIVKDGVANIPVADQSTLGLVKVQKNNMGTVEHRGVFITGENILSIKQASDNDVLAKKSAYLPITPKNLDFAVKTSVTTNAITLTEEAKSSAQEWLGTKLYNHRLQWNGIVGDYAGSIWVEILSTRSTRFTEEEYKTKYDNVDKQCYGGGGAPNGSCVFLGIKYQSTAERYLITYIDDTGIKQLVEPLQLSFFTNYTISEI